jgi:hypothetical protein
LKEAERERHDPKASKSATMATQGGNSPIGGMSEEPLVERDMDKVEAGEGRGVAGPRAGTTTCVSFMAATEQWERNMNGKRLRNES